MLGILISLLSSAGLVFLDQVLKYWASASLAPVGSMPLFPHIVELRYVLNDGAAFSMLSGRQPLLIVVTAVALAAVLIVLCRRLTSVERLAWTLIFAGGVGNLIDRVLNGQVVDYINLLFMNFAVFNFADICVTLGVVFLLISLLQDGAQARKKKNASPAQPPQNTGNTPDANA